MEKVYNEASRKSGIYQIRNKINGKVYIGSTVEFKRRATQHERSLRNNKHQNKHLQHAFNQYGEDVFVFEIIEVVENSLELRRTIEEKYIDEVFGQETCYNIRKNTIQVQRSWSSTPEETRKKMSETHKKLGTKPPDMGGWNKGKSFEEAYGTEKAEKLKKDFIAAMTGKKQSAETVAKRVEKFKSEKHWLFGEHHTEETRKKISKSKSGENHQNYGKHLPEETRKKISEANTGKHPTEETLKKLSESHKGQVAWNKGKKMEPLSAEHKKKIGVALKGRKCGPMSEEAKRKNSEAHKGEKHLNYGKHLPEETRKKISAAQKGKKKSAETRKKMSIARKGKKFPKKKQKKENA